MNMRAGTVTRFLIVMSAFAGAMQLNCVKRDLPLEEVVGAYASPLGYVGTRVVLNPDHTFELSGWSCTGTTVARGRWEQLDNGLIALSSAPAPAKPDSGASADEGDSLGDICSIDPSACQTIRFDQVRLRALGDSLEIMWSPDPNDAVKLQRER